MMQPLKHRLPLLFSIILMLLSGGVFAQAQSATVNLIFKNIVKDQPMELYDATYSNSFGEAYTINKFRYYISNLMVQRDLENTQINQEIYLIDQAKEESKIISFSVPAGDYSSLNFQIGVDSIYNVSGAQTGPLDPVKDMFWTWNTGYVMAKLEGNSPASKVVNGKYEFHIGGFSGKNTVLQTVSLPFPENILVKLNAGETMKIVIKADADAWFQDPNDLKIADKPAINSPGKYAVAMSENYKKMFSIEKVTTQQ